tara:strand:+ start:39 stop:563 length:525 start_codon:yes stop_codon:yes gene_type:complete
MKINKLIKTTMERECLFIQGNVPIDSKYFIKKIEKGIEEQTNKSYKTYLMSKMTSWNYFTGDKKFLKILLPIFDLLDKEASKPTPSWFLKDAWGFKQSFGDYSQLHHHTPHQVFTGGTIMLNEHPQSLHFPQINETLESKSGNFALFPSFLTHYNNRNTTDRDRYGVSFNLYYT